MMGVITVGLLFAAYAIGFNVIFGSTGQLFLCVGALAGLGGYASALLSDRAGHPDAPRAWRSPPSVPPRSVAC